MQNRTSAEHEPGETACESGRYHLVSVFGTPTGRSMMLKQGDVLPPAPCQFRWTTKPGTWLGYTTFMAGGYGLAHCRVFFLNAQGRVVRARVLAAQTEEAAVAEAAGIMGDAAAMEVWCGAKIVARLSAAEVRRLGETSQE